MSKIANAFKNGKAFIGFIPAGTPSLEKTKDFVIAMQKAGADLIEIGIPFSDPIAEGEVIQRANIAALKTGVTTDKIFDMITQLRKETSIPLVLLTYINPIFAYGSEKFFNRCKQCEIDGVVIPDISFEEKDEVIGLCEEFDVDFISLVAPTSKQRIQMIAKQAKGFVYAVSSMGVTGVRTEIKTNMQEIVEEIKKVTATPVAVGFGISTREQASEFANISDGVIVGSAICKIIEEHKENSDKYLYDYIKEMKGAI